MKKFSPTLLSRGFTLAEVMIAMGIVASVMVALLGMIPLGVRAVRESTNLSLSGRIAQEVISNIQQANWKQVVKTFDNQEFYFDHEGFQIKQGAKSPPSFEARVKFAEEEIQLGNITYNKGNLRKVFIEVEFTPEGKKIKPKVTEAAIANPNISTYTFYVANQNKTVGN